MINIRAKNIKLPIIILNHIKANIREYIIVLLVFIAGIFLGVLFLNNTKDEQKEEISTYINNYINQTKENKNVNSTEALQKSIKENIFLAIILWLAGTTLIGIPIVFGIITFRGFCLGYTISSCIYTMNVGKGITFVLISLLLQNLLLIPSILAIGVSRNKSLQVSYERQKKRKYKVRNSKTYSFFFYNAWCTYNICNS